MHASDVEKEEERFTVVAVLLQSESVTLPATTDTDVTLSATTGTDVTLPVTTNTHGAGNVSEFERLESFHWVQLLSEDVAHVISATMRVRLHEGTTTARISHILLYACSTPRKLVNFTAANVRQVAQVCLIYDCLCSPGPIEFTGFMTPLLVKLLLIVRLHHVDLFTLLCYVRMCHVT